MSTHFSRFICNEFTVTNTGNNAVQDATVQDAIQDAPVRDAPADNTTKRTKLLVPRYCVACVQLAASYDRKS